MDWYTSTGLHSYIGTPAATKCLQADTWYLAAGTFIRDNKGGFTTTSPITYTGQTQCFGISLTGSIKTNRTNTIVTLGFFLNDTIVVPSESIIALDKTSDINSFTLLFPTCMVANDTITVKLQANKISEITVQSLSAIIHNI